MAAQERIVFTVSPEEKAWFDKLVQASGAGQKIALFRALLDAYAEQLNFEPRPK
jgi:Holliday junction resolvasome RuvABC DNA-binding subunit